jgi:hypothetical protein
MLLVKRIGERTTGPFGLSQCSDAQFTQLRQESGENLCRRYGVPQAELGSFASISSQLATLSSE